MLRVEEFQHQNKTCYRKELEGCPVEITEQSYQATLGKLEYTRHLKRWKGRHLLVIGDEVEDVDESLVTDTVERCVGGVGGLHTPPGGPLHRGGAGSRPEAGHRGGHPADDPGGDLVGGVHMRIQNQQDEALAAGPGLRGPAAPAQVHTADLLWGRLLRAGLVGRAQGVPDRRFGPARPPDRGEIPRTDRGRTPAAGDGVRRGKCEP